MENSNEILIDINADLGEGMGNDDKIMPLISSCNIACGGHFGNETTIREAIKLAKKRGVKIGAHPSFPDKDNFGRKIVTMTKSELTETIFNQLIRFFAIAEIENVAVHHIKLHGALYNYAAKDAPTADAVVEGILQTKIRPILYVPFGSVLHKKAENLLPLSFEAFIDRRYNADGSLVSRTEENATINDKNVAWLQLQKMVLDKKVETMSGEEISIQANTFCIHGDHEHSIEILMYIHTQLQNTPLTLNK